MRADRRANPAIEDVLKRMAHKDGVIDKPRGAKGKALRERYLNEEYVEANAAKIYEQYQVIGITWAACVQAVKTNFVEQLHMKWGPKLKVHKEANKE